MVEKVKTKNRKRDANRDPITNAPGSHPVGTGLGAAVGGMAAGAATGTVAGPIGTAVGAAVGAVVGGLAGKGIAEKIDPTAEDEYWHANYANRPYVNRDYTYEDYGPAYRYGVDYYREHPGRTFEESEFELQQDWERRRGHSRLGWDDARHATRESWQRVSDAVERATPGDSDRDGK